jgi:hypothetical protein
VQHFHFKRVQKCATESANIFGHPKLSSGIRWVGALGTEFGIVPETKAKAPSQNGKRESTISSGGQTKQNKAGNNHKSRHARTL